MRIIKASELGAFLYCRKAWFYQLSGLESENQAELSGGSQMHRQHSLRVAGAGLLKLAGWALLLLALVLLAVAATLKWLV